MGRESESISDPVFDAGSRSASIVLMTLGNAAQADPVEERGAPLYRVVRGQLVGVCALVNEST